MAGTNGAVVTLRRWVVPNIGRQLILERCIHGVTEQFHRRIRPKSNSALHDQPLLVVHDDLQALDLVAIHGPDPAQEGGALIELKFGCIGTGTTRRARLWGAERGSILESRQITTCRCACSSAAGSNRSPVRARFYQRRLRNTAACQEG